MRRILLVGAITLLWATHPAHGANALFGIAEGVAEQASFGDMQEKYQPLANYLGKVIKRSVTLESSQNIQSAIGNLAKERYDLMYVRPSNVTGGAIRENRYQLVAMVKGDFTANFIARKNHPYKKPEDVLTQNIAMPEESALMSRVGVATLRDLGGDPKKMLIRNTRYQEAVNFMVENKFAEVGVVAPSTAKAWEKSGGVIFFKSKKLPFWSIIASAKISKEDVAKMQKALVEMETTDEGKAILKKLGIKGWVPGNGQDYIDLMTWLGV